MNLKGVKGIYIPEGNVKAIHSGGNLLWNIPNEGGGEPNDKRVFAVDFEDGTNGGFALYESSAVTSEAAYESNYGLHLQGPGGWGRLAYGYVAVEKGTAYTVSMMMKAVSTGVNVSIKKGDWSGTIGHAYFAGTEWTSVVLDFTAETESVIIDFGDTGTGKLTSVYVDDIVVTEVEA